MFSRQLSRLLNSAGFAPHPLSHRNFTTYGYTSFKPTGMELYATGFNAWNQLQFNPVDPDSEPEDIVHFTCVLSDNEGFDGVHPFSSYTLAHTKTQRTVSAGLIPKDEALVASSLTSEAQPHLAQASNGISLVNDSHPSISTAHLPLYPSSWIKLSQLLPSLPPITQLVAYATGFAALTAADSQVWTWGDERYAACLGRELSEPSSALNSIPGFVAPDVVADLSDLPTGPITKLAAGGYVIAALTAGNDLYVWGHASRAAAAGLSGLGVTDEPMPIIIEDHDIADVAVGEGHVLVLTTSSEVIVIGSNSNGQLGLGSAVKEVESWTKVSLEARGKIVAVAAGLRSSFLVVQAKHQVT